MNYTNDIHIINMNIHYISISCASTIREDYITRDFQNA